jgi:hypothetical protein
VRRVRTPYAVLLPPPARRTPYSFRRPLAVRRTRSASRSVACVWVEPHVPGMQRFLILALAIAFAAPAASAQQSAVIEGTVTDSVHSKPLADAIVYITREEPKLPELFRALVTDKDGRFRLDSLIAGRYSVTFSHAILDSLEVTMPTRAVALAADEHARIDFAIPAAASLRMRACAGLQLAPGTGALVGHVADAQTERSLVGALVVASWNDIVIDRATLQASNVERTGAMRVDSSGVYRLCGVPTGTTILVQLQLDTRAGSALRTDVPEDIGVKVLTLSFSAGDSLTGTAALTGTIRNSSGTPLSDADVRVAGIPGSVRSDSLGHFSMNGLPAGSQLLEARHVGYLIGRHPVELRSGNTIGTQLRLDRIVSLDTIRVLAQRNQFKQFEQNKHSPFGRFFTADQIGARNASEVSDLFYTMLGFRVVGRGFDAKLINTRGARLSGVCEPNVVIDNMQNQDINLVQPSDIGAMEVYADGFGGPPGANRGCGAVVIWTKR